MGCGFDKGLLAAHYDGETTHGEGVEVERHVGSCPECARDLAAMKDLSAAIKPLGRGAAPMSIAEGVLREIGAREPARRPWLRWGLSAAAAVLICGVTFVVMDQRRAPERSMVAAAEKSAADAPKSQYEGFGEEYEEFAAKPSPPPAEAPAAPGARAAKMEEERSRGARQEKSAVPVIRVSAADVAGARAEVEAFLKVRALKQVPGAPLLGRHSSDRYLQLDLTEGELKDLEMLLAARKETTLVRGSLEAEQKRVAEELAKSKSADGITLGAKKDRADDEKEKDAPAANEPRDLLDKDAEQKEPPRRKVIFVFEPAEPKK